MVGITVLVENRTRSKALRSEDGLSLLVEYDGVVILFDTGETSAFMENARQIGADMGAVTDIVLSHSHPDHSGGLAEALDFFVRRGGVLPRVYLHPDIFREKRRDDASAAAHGAKNLSLPAAARALLDSFFVVGSKMPQRISERIVFLGEIPRRYPEACALTGDVLEEGAFVSDPLLDDTGIACITPEGLVIITGCAHSGIINIVEHAKSVTHIQTVHAVVGGLHMRDAAPELVARTVQYFREQRIPHVYGCHCTGTALAAYGCNKELVVGDRVDL